MILAKKLFAFCGRFSVELLVMESVARVELFSGIQSLVENVSINK